MSLSLLCLEPFFKRQHYKPTSKCHERKKEDPIENHRKEHNFMAPKLQFILYSQKESQSSISFRLKRYLIQRSFVGKCNEKSESIIAITDIGLGFTVLNDVDSCFLKVLPKIARKSEVHPKKPFHSLNMHYTITYYKEESFSS